MNTIKYHYIISVDILDSIIPALVSIILSASPESFYTPLHKFMDKFLANLTTILYC